MTARQAKAVAGIAAILVAGAAVGWLCALRFTAEASLGPSPLILAAQSAFGLLTLGFIGVAGLAMLERGNPTRAALLWSAAVVLAALVTGIGIGAGAGTWAMRDRLAVTLERASAILEAIDARARNEGTIPQRLEELVPRYMDTIPRTGYRGAFRFERATGGYRLVFHDDLGLRHVYDSRSRRWSAE